MKFARHDQVKRSERTLVQRGKQNSEHNQDWIDFMDPLDWRFQIESLEDVGKEFKEEHGRIGHDTKTNLEHDRVRIHVDQLVPYKPRPPEINNSPTMKSR